MAKLKWHQLTPGEILVLTVAGVSLAVTGIHLANEGDQRQFRQCLAERRPVCSFAGWRLGITYPEGPNHVHG